MGRPGKGHRTNTRAHLFQGLANGSLLLEFAGFFRTGSQKYLLEVDAETPDGSSLQVKPFSDSWLAQPHSGKWQHVTGAGMLTSPVHSEFCPIADK